MFLVEITLMANIHQWQIFHVSDLEMANILYRLEVAMSPKHYQFPSNSLPDCHMFYVIKGFYARILPIQYDGHMVNLIFLPTLSEVALIDDHNSPIGM